MYSCMNLGLGSVSGFLPTIVRELGYTAARAQLFTGRSHCMSTFGLLQTC